jgi:Lar family restriction alleviation protein
MDEPKPCPFCGAKAFVLSDQFRGITTRDSICGKCGARGPRVYREYTGGHPEGDTEYLARVMAAWNKRALEESPA